MVAPLIPIAVGLGGAALGGAGIMSMFDGGKKSEKAVNTNSVFPESAPFSVNAQTYSPHSPYEQYSQAIQYAPVTSIQYPDYAINVNSPDATAATKKTQTVTSEPTHEYQANQGQNPTSGLDILPIAVVAALALVAYGVVTKK
jgi:flagellar basal body-associated protein FliL